MDVIDRAIVGLVASGDHDSEIARQPGIERHAVMKRANGCADAVPEFGAHVRAERRGAPGDVDSGDKCQLSLRRTRGMEQLTYPAPPEHVEWHPLAPWATHPTHAGHAENVDQFVREHARLLEAYSRQSARRYGVDHDDVRQRTVENMLVRLAPKPVEQWVWMLKTIVQRTAADIRRSERRRSADSFECVDDARLSDPVNGYSRADLEIDVRRVIATLSSEDRELCDRLSRGDVSLDDLAREQCISRDRLYRMRTRLRRSFVGVHR